MMNYVMVFAGGGIGSVIRFMLGTWIGQHWGRNFPLGTFIINVTGSFLIGLLMTLISLRIIVNPQWRLLLVVGGLGGYTTFSTFEYESGQLALNGQVGYAALNMVLSVGVGFMALKLGEAIAKII